MTHRIIKQNEMTAECWLIQFEGKKACKTCPAKNTDECGGQDIRKTGKNDKGYEVPLGK